MPCPTSPKQCLHYPDLNKTKMVSLCCILAEIWSGNFFYWRQSCACTNDKCHASTMSAGWRAIALQSAPDKWEVTATGQKSIGGGLSLLFCLIHFCDSSILIQHSLPLNIISNIKLMTFEVCKCILTQEIHD